MTLTPEEACDHWRSVIDGALAEMEQQPLFTREREAAAGVWAEIERRRNGDPTPETDHPDAQVIRAFADRFEEILTHAIADTAAASDCGSTLVDHLEHELTK